jgi:tripartite-type tricarboxylate transporter receptor subunit TctC
MATPSRKIAGASIAGILLAAAMCVMAQDYPNKPVRVITAGPGTISDIVMRHIGQQLSERWRQPVVIENRPGAGLTIGTAIAAKARADGYTLLMSDRSAIAVAPSLYRDLPYAPLRDLTPITLAAVNSSLLVAHPSFPPANLQEFIAHAKRYPGTVNMTGGTPGTAGSIATELFRRMAGVDVVLVLYKGGAASIAAIVSGETKVGFNGMPTSLPHVKTGKVKAYASTGRTRFAGTPDIPTMAEAGLPGYYADYWVGMFGPAGLPAPLVAKINRDVVEILQTPAMQAALFAQGAEASPKTPAEFAEFVKSETARMKKVIEFAGVRQE